MKKSRKGFTFIETLLYIALVTIISGVLFSFGWNVIFLRTKTNVVNETTSSAKILQEKISNEIRSADSADFENSIFNASEGKLVLNSLAEKIVIASESGKVSIKRGDEAPIFLHSNTSRVKNLVFTREIDSNNQSYYIGYTFLVEAYYPQANGRFEYQYSTDIKSGAEIRNH